MSEIPDGYFAVGNKLMTTCKSCGKFVKATRFFAGWHVCFPENLNEWRQIIMNYREGLRGRYPAWLSDREVFGGHGKKKEEAV
jgi:hypothetical protein